MLTGSLMLILVYVVVYNIYLGWTAKKFITIKGDKKKEEAFYKKVRTSFSYIVNEIRELTCNN
jgi:hypothetical protein